MDIKVKENKMSWKMVAGLIAGIVGVLGLIALRLLKKGDDE